MIRLFIVILLILLGCGRQSGPDELFASYNIFGADDRYDLEDYHDSKIRILAKSTLAMIYGDLIEQNEDVVRIETLTYGERLHLCPETPFADQISAVSCSAFLVDKDVIMTAGHCLKDPEGLLSPLEMCQAHRWVFDFTHDNESENGVVQLPTSSVYRCQTILARDYRPFDKGENPTGADFSLIKLDRPVRDRKPLTLRKRGKLSQADELIVVGHPSGLPTKIADNAFVRDNSEKNYFTANLDTFAGNSGSPVINARTGVVEGILVEGGEDYIFNFKKGCNILIRCDDDFPEHEIIMRITEIPFKKKSVLDRLWSFFRHSSN